MDHPGSTLNSTISWMENYVLHPKTLNKLVVILDDHWAVSIVAAIMYVILIFGGQKFMKSYERFNLSKTLAAWNAMLAIFSIAGTVRMAPNLYYAFMHQSFHDSVCNIEWTYIESIRIWTTLFSLSKIVELGDTAFIVLRKQPLILLHWYHHITVLIYTWYSYTDRTSSGRWYVTMNYAVHSVMYTYYAFRALKFRAPQWLRMFITLLQLSQMVVGVYIATYAYKLKQVGTPCGIKDSNMRLSFLMYFSYFLLFAKFFYDAYIRKGPRPTSSKLTQQSSNGYHKHANGVTSNGAATNGAATNGHYSSSNGHMASNLQTKKQD